MSIKTFGSQSRKRMTTFISSEIKLKGFKTFLKFEQTDVISNHRIHIIPIFFKS